MHRNARGEREGGERERRRDGEMERRRDVEREIERERERERGRERGREREGERGRGGEGWRGRGIALCRDPFTHHLDRQNQMWTGIYISGWVVMERGIAREESGEGGRRRREGGRE